MKNRISIKEMASIFMIWFSIAFVPFACYFAVLFHADSAALVTHLLRAAKGGLAFAFVGSTVSLIIAFISRRD